MTTNRQELQKEIDELQEFIDAVEAARECNLELADSVYDKYNATVERQKEPERSFFQKLFGGSS